MPFDPQKAAAKWATNLPAAADKITAGVNAVTQNPAAAATTDAAMQKARTNYAASMASGGKFATSMGKVTLEGWKQSMLQIGLAKLSSAASAAQPKMARYLTNLAQYQATYLPGIKAMPKANGNDMRARMNANFDKMAAARGKLK